MLGMKPLRSIAWLASDFAQEKLGFPRPESQLIDLMLLVLYQHIQGI